MGIWTPGLGATTGDDIFDGDNTNEVADGLAGDDTLNGNGGDDTLTGGLGMDSLFGGADNDTLLVNAGAEVEAGETYDGGAGTGDRLKIIAADAFADFTNVTISGIELLELTHGAQFRFDNFNFQTVQGVEDTGSSQSLILGAVGADDLDLSSITFVDWVPGRDLILVNGSEFNNLITGSSQDETIDGGAGLDTIDGGAGDDSIAGGDDADAITGGAGDDILDGGLGNDTISDVFSLSGLASIDAGEGDDIITISDELNSGLIEGGLGADQLNASGALAALTLQNLEVLNAGSGVTGTGDQFEVFDTIRVDASDPSATVLLTLSAGGTADLTDELLGRGAVFFGSDGDDVIITSDGDDTIDGGIGLDTLSGGDGLDTLSGGDDNDTLNGGAGGGSLSGDGGDDILNGGDGADILNGGLGADAMDGGAGSDNYFVDDGSDTVVDVSGTDTVTSSVSYSLGADIENLTLFGGVNIAGTGNAVANVIIGDGGNNSITGGGGNDTLTGGLGTDTAIYSGNRADYYVYTAGANLIVLHRSGADGTDTLTGFESLQFADGTVAAAGSPNTAPVSDAGGPYVVTQGSGVLLDGSASADPNAAAGDAITYEWDYDGDGFDDGTNSTLSLSAAQVTALGLNSHNISLRVTDAVGVTHTDTTTLYVNALPVITSNGGLATAAINVAENSTAVTDVDATDANASETLTYSKLGADAALFNIDSTTGVLTFVSAPNFEAPGDVGGNNVYDVTVRATDLQGATDDQAIAVTITNVNEAPSITSNGGGGSASINVAENTTAVTSVTVSDDAGDTQTYSIVGGADAALFGIDSGTGALSFVSARNFESPSDVGGNGVYDVIVRATDAGLLFDDQAIAVTVTNANDAPTITSSATANVNENATAILSVTVSDQDPTDTHTYSLAGGADAALFAIDSNTGALSFVSGRDFDAPSDVGGNNVYEVIVRATDVGGMFDDDAVAVTIVDQYDDVFGTSGVDNLVANAAGGRYFGLGGADTITGSSIGDVIEGGAGNDTLSAGGGNDTINYNFGDGIDSVDGGADADTLAILGNSNGQTLDLVFNGTSIISSEGGAVTGVETITANLAGGIDFIAFAGSTAGVTVNLAAGTASGGVTLSNVESAFGGAFNDVLTGDGNANTLGGSAGADTLDGGAGADVLIGGAGNDLYIIADADTITELGGGGVDTVQSSIDYSLGGELENLTLIGAAISGTGNALANVIFGNAANNTINGGAGVDSMYGGAGDDTYTVDATGDLVNELLNGGTDAVLSSATYSLAGDVENLTLTGVVAVNATGNSLANIIAGNIAANIIAGGAGGDTINAGAGNDTINYAFGDGIDTIDGGADADTMAILGNVNGQTLDLVYNGSTIISVEGGAVSNVESFSANLAGGIDTVTFAGSSVGVTINLATGAASGNATLAGVENAFGGAFNDFITGDNQANTLGGSSGADTLAGGGGADTLIGGAGNDTINYNFGDGIDSVDGGADLDTLAILGNANGQTLDLVFNGTSIISSEGGSVTGVETLNVNLAGGIDVVAFAGSTAAVTINLATGAASGGVSLAGVEAAFGGAFNDFITGDANANTLGGSSGADTLTGGGGADTLIGGAGNDSFLYAAGAGADVISDFDANATGGQDLLDISALGINGGDFGSRVVITDLGADTLLTIDGVITITLSNVTGDGDNVITSADFIFGP